MSLKTFFISSCSFGLLMLSPVAVAAKTPTKHLPPHKTKKHYLSVSAIPGADEKNFQNSASRCLVPSIQALHEQAIKQMAADIATSPQNHADAVETYRTKLAIIWSAMAEPYCGYGSQGITAVRHSFSKSVVKTRTEFLAAIKTK